VLGFDEAAGGDEVFRDLVLARIIEPSSKADSLRVLKETGTGFPALSSVLGKCLRSLVMSRKRAGIRVFNRASPRLNLGESLIYVCVTVYIFLVTGVGGQQCRT
jgi:hypothetical protein